LTVALVLIAWSDHTAAPLSAMVAQSNATGIRIIRLIGSPRTHRTHHSLGPLKRRCILREGLESFTPPS